MGGGRAPAASAFAVLALGAAALRAAAPPDPAASQPATSSFACQPHVADFGEGYQYTTAVVRFTCSNHGDRPVTVTSVDPRGAGAWSTGAPAVVFPGQSVAFEVHQPLGPQLGPTTFRVGVSTDDPAQPIVRLGLAGFVQSAYEPEMLNVELGVVDPAGGGRRTVDLSSREVERLELLEVSGLAPPFRLAATGRAGDGGQGLRLEAALDPGAALGLHAATAELRTNVTNQPRYRLQLRANVFGDVVPGVNPLDLGLVRAGETLRGAVELRSRSRRPFSVAEAKLTGSAELSATAEACAAAEPSCVRIVIAGAPSSPGALDGDLQVVLKGAPEPLPLRWHVFVASRDQQIKKIDLTGAAASPLQPPDPR